MAPKDYLLEGPLFVDNEGNGDVVDKSTILSKDMTSTSQERSVSWAPSTIAMNNPKLHEKTVQSTWYTKEDFDAFKKDCEKTIRLIRLAASGGKKLKAEKYCALGLEFKSDMIRANKRRQRRRQGLDIVLAEQYDQQIEGSNNPEFIADLYEDISALCHRDAHELAVELEREILESNQNDTEKKSLTSKEDGSGSGSKGFAQIFSSLPRRRSVDFGGVRSMVTLKNSTRCSTNSIN